MNVKELIKQSSQKQEETELFQFEQQEITDLLFLAKKLAAEEPKKDSPAMLFRQCCTMRMIYQTILRKQLKPEGNEEYQYSVFFEKEESLQYLTNDDAFFSAVHTLGRF